VAVIVTKQLLMRHPQRLWTLFGIYLDPSRKPGAGRNIANIAPRVWALASQDMRIRFPKTAEKGAYGKVGRAEMRKPARRLPKRPSSATHASYTRARALSRCALAPLSDHHGRYSVIPGVAISKFLPRKIPNALPKLLAATSKITIVKDDGTHIAEQLHRGNVVAKVPGQAVELIPARYAETIALKAGVPKETGSSTRERTFVPGAIPSWVIPVDPWILGEQHETAKEKSQY